METFIDQIIHQYLHPIAVLCDHEGFAAHDLGPHGRRILSPKGRELCRRHVLLPLVLQLGDLVLKTKNKL